MCLFHWWGKWKQYEVTLTSRRITKRLFLCEAVEQRQRRQCKWCGKVEDELIYTKVVRGRS